MSGSYRRKRERYEGRNNDRRIDKSKIKSTLKRTLNELDEFIESRRRGSRRRGSRRNGSRRNGSRCENESRCENDSRSSSSCSTNCSCSGTCGKCLVASRASCDAPVMCNLFNTVFTTLPRFRSTINVYPTTVTILPNINYYVRLPKNGTGEVKLLWPLVWMIPLLIVLHIHGPLVIPPVFNVDCN